MKRGRKLPADVLLAFGAHPDDIEFGCGGVIAAHTAAGGAAHLAVCSHGEAASQGTPRQRMEEAKKAAAILSATLEFLELDGDAHLESNVGHAIKVAGVIRQIAPNVVLAPSATENQHPDHRALGTIVRNAARLARYGGLKELKRLAAHSIDQLFFYAITPEAEPAGISPVFVDVSQASILARWTAAMQAHASQLPGSRLGDRDHLELQLTRARLNGLRSGIGHAIALFPNDPLVVDWPMRPRRAARRF